MTVVAGMKLPDLERECITLHTIRNNGDVLFANSEQTIILVLNINACQRNQQGHN